MLGVTETFGQISGPLSGLVFSCLLLTVARSISPTLVGADGKIQDNSFDTALASPPADPQHVCPIKLKDESFSTNKLALASLQRQRLHYSIFYSADLINYYLNNITTLEKFRWCHRHTYTCRSTESDNVSRDQGHTSRKIGEDLWH